MNPREDIDFDPWLRYVDRSYPEFGLGFYGDQPIPPYWEFDLRLAWRPSPDLELSVVGQNLLHPSHQEGYQDAFGAVPLEVQRGVYAAFRFDF